MIYYPTDDTRYKIKQANGCFTAYFDNEAIGSSRYFTSACVTCIGHKMRRDGATVIKGVV